MHSDTSAVLSGWSNRGHDTQIISMNPGVFSVHGERSALRYRLLDMPLCNPRDLGRAGDGTIEPIKRTS